VSSLVVAMEEKGLISKRAHSSRTILFMEGLQCIVKLLHCGYITPDYRIICRIVASTFSQTQSKYSPVKRHTCLSVAPRAIKSAAKSEYWETS